MKLIEDRQTPSSTGRIAIAAPIVGVVALLALGGCRQRPPVGTTQVTSTRVERTTTSSEDGMTVLARARTRSLATTKNSVLFGDESKDALSAVAKRGGAPVFIGKRAPLDIAVLDSSVAWIGAPGDAVYRAPLGPGTAEVVLLNGRFTAVAAAGDELFVTALAGDAGALLRVRERRVATLASLAYPPRDVLFDGTDAFVLTDSELYGVPREGDGEMRRLVVVGDELAGLALSEDSVFTTMGGVPSRVLFRAPKRGGRGEQLAWDVRKGPIAAWGGWVYFFDARSPTLWRVPVVGGPPTPIIRAPALDSATAIVVDESAIYVAVEADDGRLLAIARPE